MNRIGETDPWVGEHLILIQVDSPVVAWNGFGPRPMISIMEFPKGYTVHIIGTERHGKRSGVRVNVTKD